VITFGLWFFKAEKENSEEKENKAKSEEKTDNDNNPMAKLFYGKVLTEGCIQGEAFSRVEAFGQWPLQVNLVNDSYTTENPFQ
jgi:hypothetical protein